MAARVLHFGYDYCYRVQVLKRAGYVVTQTETLDDLSLDLRQSHLVDAVVLSEDDPNSTEQAADIVRRHSKAPVILFRCTLDNLDQRKFDQIYSGFVRPEVWLARTAELIAQSAKLRERSERLRVESERLRVEINAVWQETERQRARARRELARHRPRRP